MSQDIRDVEKLQDGGRDRSVAARRGTRVHAHNEHSNEDHPKRDLRTRRREVPQSARCVEGMSYDVRAVKLCACGWADQLSLSRKPLGRK